MPCTPGVRLPACGSNCAFGYFSWSTPCPHIPPPSPFEFVLVPFVPPGLLLFRFLLLLFVFLLVLLPFLVLFCFCRLSLVVTMPCSTAHRRRRNAHLRHLIIQSQREQQLRRARKANSSGGSTGTGSGEAEDGDDGDGGAGDCGGGNNGDNGGGGGGGGVGSGGVGGGDGGSGGGDRGGGGDGGGGGGGASGGRSNVEEAGGVGHQLEEKEGTEARGSSAV